MNRRLGITMLALLPALLAGCATKGPVDDESVEGLDFKVKVTLDRESYRPGEAVVAKVEVANVTGKTIESPNLSYSSAQIYFTPTANDLPMRRDPVFSPLELGVTPIQFEPGKIVSREFVLTRVTESAGDFALSVGYDPNFPPMFEKDGKAKKGADEGPPPPGKPLAWSAPAFYKVAGPARFHRDFKGVLSPDDAEEICLAALGKPASQIERDLIWDEMRFLKYWICLTISPESLAPGEPAKKAWFVNPYLGAISSEAPVQLTYLGKRAGPNVTIQPHAGPATGTPSVRPGGRLD